MDQSWIQNRGRSPFMYQARIPSRGRSPFMSQARIPSRGRSPFMYQARIPSRGRPPFYVSGPDALLEQRPSLFYTYDIRILYDVYRIYLVLNYKP